MNAQRLQGGIFCFCAMLVVLATSVIGRFEPQTELIVLSALIIVLGIPHGALDTIFAYRLYMIRSPWEWLSFGVIYIFLAALVVCLWAYIPVLFLVGFLLISVAHFSGDLTSGISPVSRVLYAGSIIIFPTFLHASEITQLFAQLVGHAAAQLVVPYLTWLAWPWLLGTIFAIVVCARRNVLTSIEIFSVSLLAISVPPLFAFTVFFCGMHSARHIIRTFIYSGQSSWRVLMVAALLPMVGVVLTSVLAWHFLKDTPLDTRLLQIIFVGLAALTVPHMILVERVRLSGWLKGAST
jgi:Brp/Blh family beta-carotene 15,15'-monooxygenase